MRSCLMPHLSSKVIINRRHLLELVKGVPWFRYLDNDELEELLQGAHVHVTESRQWLFRQETPVHWLYVVVSGAARLVRSAGDGRLATIRCVERGGILGEFSLISQQAYYLYSAESLRRTHVLAISAERCQEMLDRRAYCRSEFMAHLAQELTERLEDMALLTQADAMARLVSFILRQMPPRAILPYAIRLTIPKCWLAAQLAMTPETLSRLLSKLRQMGLIGVERQRLIINDERRLKSLAIG